MNVKLIVFGTVVLFAIVAIIAVQSNAFASTESVKTESIATEKTFSCESCCGRDCASCCEGGQCSNNLTASGGCGCGN